ncbi:hypothetical protein KY308_01510 [Candidatus Woesearchaeota archaeon]|nr:hypothetical protein [Candidatus Woesearchaeota archaeon]
MGSKGGIGLADRWYLKLGLLFGNLVVYILEKIIPSFRNKEQNLHGIKDTHLKRFNLSNKENFKRNTKLSIRIYFSLIFWVYLGFALPRITGDFFNKQYHLTILGALFLVSIIFIPALIYISYKLAYK